MQIPGIHEEGSSPLASLPSTTRHDTLLDEQWPGKARLHSDTLGMDGAGATQATPGRPLLFSNPLIKGAPGAFRPVAFDGNNKERNHADRSQKVC